MKLVATYPDVERLIVDYLTPLLDATVSVGVPTDWKPVSPPHVSVSWDGTPFMQHPVVAYPTVRVTARAATTTAAKALALEAQAHLLAHEGDGSIAGIASLTGVLPARDPDTKAELASLTVRVTVRSTPLDT